MTISQNTNVRLCYENPTTLELAGIITTNGRIPFSEYMKSCLFGRNGYYSSGRVNIGADFTTEAKSTPVLGWTIGECAYRLWTSMDQPTHFTIEEQGAGDGDMAKATLDYIKEVYPDFYNVLREKKYRIGEISPELQKRQAAALSGHYSIVQISNPNSLEETVEGLLVSNELPDAFPVEIVTIKGGKVVQKYITINDNCWVEVWDTPTIEVRDYIDKHTISLSPTQEEPINLQAETWMRGCIRRLQRGAILTIDYGKEGIVGEEHFPAVRPYGFIDGKRITHNVFSDPFDIYRHPGQHDLTTDINFQVFRNIAETARVVDKDWLYHNLGRQDAIGKMIQRITSREDLIEIIKNAHLWGRAHDETSFRGLWYTKNITDPFRREKPLYMGKIPYMTVRVDLPSSGVIILKPDGDMSDCLSLCGRISTHDGFALSYTELMWENIVVLQAEEGDSNVISNTIPLDGKCDATLRKELAAKLLSERKMVFDLRNEETIIDLARTGKIVLI